MASAGSTKTSSKAVEVFTKSVAGVEPVDVRTARSTSGKVLSVTTIAIRWPAVAVNVRTAVWPGAVVPIVSSAPSSVVPALDGMPSALSCASAAVVAKSASFVRPTSTMHASSTCWVVSPNRLQVAVPAARCAAVRVTGWSG